MNFTRYLWVLVLASGLANAADIDGTITYQAQIKQNGTPANGTFDFQFRLFTDGTVGVGSPVGAIKTLDNVVLANGQLSTSLNFGPPSLYTGTQLFLEIGIRDGASNQAYTLLNPRQRLTEVPFASFADHADFAAVTGADSVNSASIVNGSISSVDIDSTQIQRRSATMATTCAGANQSIKTINTDGTVSCETDDVGAAGGGITSITAGTGLSGGTITTSGTIAIAAGGVGSAQINPTQVQQRSATMATTCSGANQSIKTINTDGTVTCETDDTGTGGGSGWGLTGNAAATTDFLGTTNATALILKANNARVAGYTFVAGITLNPSGSVGNGTNVVEGHAGNTITAGVTGGTVSGGGVQQTAPQVVGVFNHVTDNFGTVGGGYGNRAGDGAGTTGDKNAATVGGGFNNDASGLESTVAGGNGNTASGKQSFIGGGFGNEAAGEGGMVVGGFANEANAPFSFAGGQRAKVRTTDNGAFVWGDFSDTVSVTSSAPNQFTARFAGGVRFFTNSNLTNGCTLAPGGGSWSCTSDRNQKTNFEPVDAESVLERVVQLPMTTWNYKTQADDIRHIGPMAQDFYSNFGVGEDERHITGVDADGVALAAIQGLNAKLERENGELRNKNTELEQRLIRLEQTLLGTERNAGR